MPKRAPSSFGHVLAIFCIKVMQKVISQVLTPLSGISCPKGAPSSFGHVLAIFCIKVMQKVISQVLTPLSGISCPKGAPPSFGHVLALFCIKVMQKVISQVLTRFSGILCRKMSLFVSKLCKPLCGKFRPDFPEFRAQKGLRTRFGRSWPFLYVSANTAQQRGIFFLFP